MGEIRRSKRKPHTTTQIKILKNPNLKMKLLAVVLLALVAGPALGETETCLDFECPNEAMDGGKFAVGPCSGDFCYCSYGVPYLHHCEEPLVFNEKAGVCDWCFDMCDSCGSSCSACPADKQP